MGPTGNQRTAGSRRIPIDPGSTVWITSTTPTRSSLPPANIHAHAGPKNLTKRKKIKRVRRGDRNLCNYRLRLGCIAASTGTLPSSANQRSATTIGRIQPTNLA